MRPEDVRLNEFEFEFEFEFEDEDEDEDEDEWGRRRSWNGTLDGAPRKNG